MKKLNYHKITKNKFYISTKITPVSSMRYKNTLKYFISFQFAAIHYFCTKFDLNLSVMYQGKVIVDSMTHSSGDGVDMADSGHDIFLVEFCHNSEGRF